MRDLLSKAMTGSMIAGAALFVAACGGGTDTTANNTMTTDLEADAWNDMGMTNDMAMDPMMNDMGLNTTDPLLNDLNTTDPLVNDTVANTTDPVNGM